MTALDEKTPTGYRGISSTTVPRKRVIWKWEDEDESGEGIGPVYVDQLDESGAPVSSESWDRWVRRSEAERYAQELGADFIADE
jgi:hypothetical protein